jgi:hypothetical protein
MPETTTRPTRFARPERWGFALREDTAGTTPLELPRRSMAMGAVVVGVFFVVFAGVLVSQIARLNLHALKNVFSLMAMLFQLFWILGWAVGVVILGAVTVLLLLYRETARLSGGRLITATRLGPFEIIAEYDLARVRNLRIETEGEGASVRFDYGEGSRNLGDTMPRPDAERLVATLRAAMPSSMAPTTERARIPEPAPLKIEPPAEAPPRPLSLGSKLALVAANFVPLLGVLFGGWKLDEVMVLFWAESAVIGFYTLLKMAVVGKWLAIFSGVFFAGHFGGFMAIHFLFIYELFVRGPTPWGDEPAAVEALTNLFTPLWPALLALFLSHGLSFEQNFLERGEYRSATIAGLMTAPYRRIILMQFTLIFGGWLVLLLKNPVPALVVLIVLKVVADLRSHHGERGVRIS